MKTAKKSPQKGSPNETRGSETVPEATNPEMNATEPCPNCGMPPEEWKGNKGHGVRKDEMVYCCQGCAEEGDCTCE